MELTRREIEVINLIALGLPVKVVARHLFISPETVKKHLQHIYLKLGAQNKIEALQKRKELTFAA